MNIVCVYSLHVIMTLLDDRDAYALPTFTRQNLWYMFLISHLQIFILYRDDPVHMVYRTPHIHLNGDGEVHSILVAYNCMSI